MPIKRKQMPNKAFAQRCFLLSIAAPELLRVTSEPGMTPAYARYSLTAAMSA